MKYLLALLLAFSLAACEPEDVVDVDVNVPDAVENAAGEVQEGVQEVGGALENIGEEGAETGE